MDIQKEWKISTAKVNKDNIIETILKSRGIKDIEHFLYPHPHDLIPLASLPNIKEASDLLLKSMKEQKAILVWADADTDGVTAGSMLCRYLLEYTDNISWTINKGKVHGFTGQDLSQFIGVVDVIVMVDAGSEDTMQHQYLKDHGIDVIILDHHEFKEYPKNAILVSSAKHYANPHLSGAGVTWKFIKFIDEITGQCYGDDYMDLAAVGIIGDVQAVDESSFENRYICQNGFKNLMNKALKEILGNNSFDSQSVSFSIAPLINATQRSLNNNIAMEFFLLDDPNEIKNLLIKMKEIKVNQDEEVKKMMEDIKYQLHFSDWENKKVITAFVKKGDHCGLLAGKIASEYCRPTIILHENEDQTEYKGSMRGFGIEDFKGVINNTKLATAQGHKSSAGIKILKENFPKFIEKVNTSLKDIEFKLQYEADVILTPSQITPSLIERISQINLISGNGFKPIQVVIENIIPKNIIRMQEKHTKFTDGTLTYIAWNHPSLKEQLLNEEGCVVKVDVLGALQMNVFKGNATKQLIISDIKIKQQLEFLTDDGAF